MELVLATANPHKAEEIAAVLGRVPGLVLRPRPDGVGEVDESGTTLLENARLKARALSEATGLPAVADDTGLMVDALGGEPGVFSARYAGESATDADNVAKLLDELRGVRGATERRAHFSTVAVVAHPGGAEQWAEGTVDGVIAEAPRGDHGFGYDPVFVPDAGGGRTFAEMTLDEKEAFSHRGRAFRALAALLCGEAATGGEPLR